MNKIGRYELVEKLGQGGMGVVYRAFDPLLQRVVAVKLIGAIETNDELRERFFREARAAGQLSHKNIITIHDLGEHEGQPFLAMEFLEGQDLQQRMASRAPMSLQRKLELAIEVCEGIEYAHVHGVIHRDIKPANIFITTSGVAKILDFGLARIITSELTNSNMMMGTLNYMAPEQVRGERADHRSDIFSTGVVLYELFGGRKAFEGDSFGATLYKILQEVPEPLPNIDAHLPPELVGIVEYSLEKTREARYQHMSEMVRDLTDYRQRMILINSPTYGTLAPDAATMAVPATPIPSERPGSGRPRTADHTMPGATMPATAVPVTPTPVPTATPSSRRSTILAASLVCVAVIAALVLWSTRDGSPAAPQPTGTAAPAPADTTQQDIANRLELASKALQAGDEAGAQRHADAVLAISPNHTEALRLRAQAQQAASTATKGLANARNLMASGRFEEASRAAGEVLAVDPGNADAKRLMDEGSARSRGKGVEEARARTVRARSAAADSGASRLASAAFGAALAAEREATALFRRGQLAEATTRFWEATGLFRSAEIAAQTEAAARAERARATAADRKPEPPAPPAAPPPAPTPPSMPASSGTSLPVPPPSAVPVAPPAPPAPAPSPAQTPPAADPASGIREVIDRYKAALESRSLESLKRLWPSLGGAQEAAIRGEFQNAKSISVDIVSPQITVSGSTATATFTRRYQLQTADRVNPRTETRTTMSLHRSGTAWVIDQIRYEAVK